MPVIVDTSVWIDFFHDVGSWQVRRLEDLVRKGEVVLGDLIVCEILQGIRTNRAFDHVRRHLGAFPIYAMVGVEGAVRSARNYRRLRDHGYTVRKTIDCLIATFCIEADLELLHNDRDFDACEKELGLRCVHPELGSG